jgi:hypothetical protein
MLEAFTKYWGFYFVAAQDIKRVGIPDLAVALGKMAPENPGGAHSSFYVVSPTCDQGRWRADGKASVHLVIFPVSSRFCCIRYWSVT